MVSAPGGKACSNAFKGFQISGLQGTRRTRVQACGSRMHDSCHRDLKFVVARQVCILSRRLKRSFEDARRLSMLGIYLPLIILDAHYINICRRTSASSSEAPVWFWGDAGAREEQQRRRWVKYKNLTREDLLHLTSLLMLYYFSSKAARKASRPIFMRFLISVPPALFLSEESVQNSSISGVIHWGSSLHHLEHQGEPAVSPYPTPIGFQSGGVLKGPPSQCRK